jgi:hypothetical protein
VSVVDAARMLGFDDMVEMLLRHATPVQQLLAACAAADRAGAESAKELTIAAHTAEPEDLARRAVRLTNKSDAGDAMWLVVLAFLSAGGQRHVADQ